MTNENLRFKKQFSEKQWSKLCVDAEFMHAWDSQDIIKAGEIANRTIEGDESNIKEARTQRVIKRALGDLIDIKFKCCANYRANYD